MEKIHAPEIEPRATGVWAWLAWKNQTRVGNWEGFLSPAASICTEMQKAASMASVLVLSFLPNCANFWALDAQRLCNCWFFKYQHVQLVQMCYLWVVHVHNLCRQHSFCKCNWHRWHSNFFLRGSNKKFCYFVANLKLEYLRLFFANFLG